MVQEEAAIPGQSDSAIPRPREKYPRRWGEGLWAILRRAGWLRGEDTPKRDGTNLGPHDLWAAFEYLVGEHETTGRLPVDLVEALGTTLCGLKGQARFEVQCRLAATLADREVPRFLVALRLATLLPVPQARGVLLAMLTGPDLARWRPTRPAVRCGKEGSKVEETHDLRPLVIAALGQLRDPSLLGMFHRLLEKMSTRPTEHQNLIAAVQWSLMNLAPGGQGEPMPASILSTRPVTAPDDVPESGPSGPAVEAASTAEAFPRGPEGVPATDTDLRRC